MRPAVDTAELATRTCKRGHTGEYVARTNGGAACKSCVKSSMAKYRGAEEVKLSRLRENSEERLAELERIIPKLRLELELSQAEYDYLSRQLVILGITK